MHFEISCPMASSDPDPDRMRLQPKQRRWLRLDGMGLLRGGAFAGGLRMLLLGRSLLDFASSHRSFHVRTSFAARLRPLRLLLRTSRCRAGRWR